MFLFELILEKSCDFFLKILEKEFNFVIAKRGVLEGLHSNDKFLDLVLQPELTAADIPSPIVNDGFVQAVKKSGMSFTDDPHDRLFRAHGKYLILYIW